MEHTAGWNDVHFRAVSFGGTIDGTLGVALRYCQANVDVAADSLLRFSLDSPFTVLQSCNVLHCFALAQYSGDSVWAAVQLSGKVTWNGPETADARKVRKWQVT